MDVKINVSLLKHEYVIMLGNVLMGENAACGVCKARRAKETML